MSIFNVILSPEILTFVGGIFAVSVGAIVTLRNSTGETKDKKVEEAPVLDPHQKALVESYQELYDINQTQLTDCLTRANILMERLDSTREELGESREVISELKAVLKEAQTLISIQSEEIVRLRA